MSPVISLEFSPDDKLQTLIESNTMQTKSPVLPLNDEELFDAGNDLFVVLIDPVGKFPSIIEPILHYSYGFNQTHFYLSYF